MIAVTQAMNAAGEAARLYVHSVDFSAGGPLPGVHVLPGTALTGPLIQDPARAAVLASSGRAWRGGYFEARHEESALASFRAAPFDTWPDADNHTTPGWREWAAGVVQDARTLSNLLVTAGLGRDGDTWRGKLESRPWPPEGTPGRIQAPGGVLPLDIAPRMVLPLQGGEFLVLGFAGGDGPILLQAADAANLEKQAPVPIAAGGHPSDGRHLAGAAVSADGATLWVLFSGAPIQETGVTPTSWLYAVAIPSLAVLGPPLALPGVAQAEHPPLSASRDGGCWVTTRVRGADNGQVSKVALAEREGARAPVLAQSWSIVGVQQELSVTPDPESDDVLVAIDAWLEYWPGGGRTGIRHTFDAPVAAVRWTDSGPVVAEGNRLHRVTLPECVPEATVALQSGWVADMAWVPASALPHPDADADGVDDAAERRAQSKPDNPDTDGDGIPDGSDPYPNAPSPWLEAGAEVVFPYTAVGRQLRALQIESHGAPDAQWRIDFDAEALPWLRIHPRNFRGSGYAYLGVDPERFDPDGVTAGTLQVSLAGKPRGNRPGYTAAYSPATVHVRVEPPRDPLRAILWLWPAEADKTSFRDASDPRGLRELGDVAGGYPYYFSLVEHFGPFSESLDHYSIAIITARAAAEGVLTQKALFDYLSGGGAILFLGQHLEGDHYRDLNPWLAPLGVKIAMDAPLNGRFTANNSVELLRNWRDFTMEGGCRLAVEAPGDLTVPADSEGGQVFVARPHGYGRIALFSAASPLESTALKNTDNRAFALDLLYWLSRAGYAVDDRDGDGLLDGTEDQNNNGAVDPGETNWLDPDTDNDGIPDGAEDTNRNGQVDPGETDPRAVDSDGDGVFDGADGAPVG